MEEEGGRKRKQKKGKKKRITKTTHQSQPSTHMTLTSDLTPHEVTHRSHTHAQGQGITYRSSAPYGPFWSVPPIGHLHSVTRK